jgi:hypothetical protein
MALYHGKFTPSISGGSDPCNTLFKDWDHWWDVTWARLVDDILLRCGMERANMLYTRASAQAALPSPAPRCAMTELSPEKMRWYNSIYGKVRALRDNPANTPEVREKFTNLLAELILLRTA